MNCNFDKAWVGKCKNALPCSDHENLTCCVCGKPATQECPATFGFVCGCPLCDSCEHELTEQGVNSFGGHCRKGEQKHFAWYVQEYIQKQGLEILDSESWGYPYIKNKVEIQ